MKPAARLIAPLLAAFCTLAFTSAAGAAAAGGTYKGDAAKGATAAATCLACHTADGSRGQNAYPILQGQHPEYLVKQLREFKSGARKNAIMSGMASALTEEQMADIAAFYAGKQAKPGQATNKDTIRLGEKIYRGGLIDKKVPACAACHSPNGAGIPVQYPRVGGQHAEYTKAQLIAFRKAADDKTDKDGRTNSAQMMGVAANLSDREINAVADYIAGLH